MIRLAILVALAAPAVLAQGVRVEPRLFVKEKRFFFSGGLAWFDRGDYYDSVGFLASAAYYLRESDAVEARLGLFASWTSPSADEVFQGTGLQPDAQKPLALIALGWRHSLAYGKVTTGESVLHFDVQFGGDLGLLVEDRGAAPALLGFGGIVARFGNHFFGQLDLSVVASPEKRSNHVFTLGFMPTLMLGGAL